MIRALKLALAPLALVAGCLFLATPANAATFSGTCNQYVTGSYTAVTINDTTSSCTIGVNVTSTGPISITTAGPTSLQDVESSNTTSNGAITISSGGSLTAKTISTKVSPISITTSVSGANIQTAGITTTTGYIYVNASGTVDVTAAITTTSNTTGGVGNVLIEAGGNLETQAITTTLTGNIDLKAQMTSGNNNLFTIGGTGQANGVNGVLTAGNGAIYVTNGSATSTAGITLTNVSKINIGVSGAKSAIILNAQNGTLNLPTGTMDADGSGSAPAGQIQLLANTVAFPTTATATLSANNTSTLSSNNGVAIAAATVTHDGLTIEANFGGFAYLLPQGATTVTDNASNGAGSLSFMVTNSLTTQGPLTVEGTSTSTLTVEANSASSGYNAQVGVYAYPISFSTGLVVILESTGSTLTNHSVTIENPGTLTGIMGLTMVPSLEIEAMATSGGNGGQATIAVDQAQFSRDFIIYAYGPTSGNGDGGSISVTSSQLSIPSNISPNFFAFAGAGTGNSQGVYLNVGTANVVVGEEQGQYSINTQGGSTGGNAGPVTVSASGAISVYELLANASSSGNGAQVLLNGTGGQLINVGGSAIDASGPTPGSVTITDNGPITVGAAGINIAAGTSSGGNISLVSTGSGANGVVTVTGALNADAEFGAPNTGGNITISGASLVLGGSQISASGQAGGTISLTETGTTTITLGTGSGQVSVTAAGINADGGSINIQAPQASVVDAGLVIDLSANGTGGNLTINANQLSFTGTGSSIDVSGDNAAGTISLITPSANPVMLTPGSVALTANGVDGIGGTIVISNAAVPAPIPPATVSYIDVNKIIALYSRNVGSSITINGITCAQSPYTGGVWPAAYWDCTGQNAAVIPLVPATAAGLVDPTIVLGALNTANVQLYTMNSISDWNNFFAVNAQNTNMTDLGETLVDSSNSFIASSVFVNQGNGSANPYPDAATAYQLGHAFDVAKGNFSSQTTFTNAVTTDFSTTGLLNTTPCTTVFAFNTALCTGASNSQIFENLYFGGVQPSNAVLFQALFEHVQTGSITTVGYESVLNYLPTSLNATTVEIGVGSLTTCTLYNPGVNGYPNGKYTQYCGSSETNAAPMHDVVADSPPSVLNELRRVGTTYYLFHNPDQYRAYMAANGLGVAPYGANDFGTTKVNSQGVPQYSAIFELNQAGLANPNIQYTTALQVGNGFDYLAGFVAVGGVQGPVNVRFSDSLVFRTQLDSDWTSFNAASPCVASGNGIFNEFAPASSPQSPPYTYICNGTAGTGGSLNTPYSIPNEHVLSQTWPGVYTDAQSGMRNYAADFQIAYAVILSYRDQIGTSPRFSADYMQNSFQCSKALLSQVKTNELLPTTVPSGCPTITQISNCQKLFLTSGYFPDGNVFNCVLTGTMAQTTLAGQVQAKIQYLGGNTTNTAIKQSLGAAQSNVYFFANPNAITTAFTQANLPSYPLNYVPFTTANAVTYPIGQMWYSFVWESNQFTTSITQQIVVTTHELGHTVDYFNGQPSQVNLSGFTLYDAAMQNDFC